MKNRESPDFKSLEVGISAFIFYHMLTFIRYIEVHFNFALVDCVRYKEDFVKPRFCSSVHILFRSAFSIPVIGLLGYKSLRL